MRWGFRYALCYAFGFYVRLCVEPCALGYALGYALGFYVLPRDRQGLGSWFVEGIVSMLYYATWSVFNRVQAFISTI